MMGIGVNEAPLLYSTMGELVQRHRVQAELSISELARISGISKGVISMIESGDTKRPGLRTILQLAKPLTIPIAAIVDLYTEIENRAETLHDLLSVAVEIADVQTVVKVAVRFLHAPRIETLELMERLFAFSHSVADTKIKLALYKVIIRFAREHGIQKFLAKGLLQQFLIEMNDLKRMEEAFLLGIEALHYSDFLHQEERITLYYQMAFHSHDMKKYETCIELGKRGHDEDTTRNETKERVALAICNSYVFLGNYTALEEHLSLYVELGYGFITERVKYFQAIILSKKGRYAEAIPLLKECVKEATRNNRLHRVNYLLDALFSVNDTDAIEKVLEQEEQYFAFDFVNPYNFYELGTYYKFKGSFLLSQNRFDDGIDAYLQGMHFFGEINDLKGIMACTEDLYTFHYEKGRFLDLEVLGKLRNVCNNMKQR